MMLWAFPFTVMAHPFTIDQSNDEANGFGTVSHTIHSLLFYSPEGQSFTPTSNSLSVVELRTKDFAPNNSLGANLLVKIRQGSMTGPIIGTSLTVTLPDGFGITDIMGSITHFDFPTPVPLVPGNVYVLEVVFLSTDNWGLLSNGNAPPFNGGVTDYLGGQGFLQGTNPAPQFDLYFREGPEQQTDKCAVKSQDISCKLDSAGGYSYTFTVTNNTGNTVTNVLVTPPIGSTFTITPQMIPVSLGPGQTSLPLTVSLSGAPPGQKICFTVTLMAKDGTSCCTVEVCPMIPSCCGQVSLSCVTGSPGNYNLTITNLTSNTIPHVYLYPPAGVTITPGYFPVTIGPGGSTTQTVTISGIGPGKKLCFRVSLHTKDMQECCSFEICLKVPECP
ncbi:MAG: hypothetical protein ACXWID_05375 [Pyrinomonadaceae bacterium]